MRLESLVYDLLVCYIEKILIHEIGCFVLGYYLLLSSLFESINLSLNDTNIFPIIVFLHPREN